MRGIGYTIRWTYEVSPNMHKVDLEGARCTHDWLDCGPGIGIGLRPLNRTFAQWRAVISFGLLWWEMTAGIADEGAPRGW